MAKYGVAFIVAPVSEKFPDAWVKLGRADDKLTEIAKFLVRYVDEHPMAGVGVESWEDSPTVRIVRISGVPLPNESKSLIGEHAGLVRSALDYLVYSLAESDSGKPQEGTQFPICDKPAEFARKRPVSLRGVSNPHAALIEARQPYNGGDWLARIRDLSNIDKHRHLHPVLAIPSVAMHAYSLARTEATEKHAKRITAAVTEVDVDVNVHLGVALRVAFPDGAPVIRTLDEAHTQAVELVKAFESLT